MSLENLARTHSIKAEPFDPGEFNGLLHSGRKRLKDAGNTDLSPESRFTLAYDAAHSFSLAAVRRTGYRPANVRYWAALTGQGRRAWYYLLPNDNIRAMGTLTVKIPEALENELSAAVAQEHISKSTLVRRALENYLAQRKSAAPFVSALDRAGDLVGCFEGGPGDLASNPEHMADFGKV